MAKFELVEKYAGHDELLPQRGTMNSAGYDLILAEDAVIYPSSQLSLYLAFEDDDMVGSLFNAVFPRDDMDFSSPQILSEIANETAKNKETSRPRLVSTGVKCKLAEDEFLMIVPRSSTPLKYWISIANSPGIIDADYYNNSDNEGEIFLQLINMFPKPIQLKKGDKIAQGIICKYNTTEDDLVSKMRAGGFGSTN